MSIWLARFSLVAVLLFSQALYAGHGVVHGSGDLAGCQVCLQACGSGAALAAREVGPVIADCILTPVAFDVLPAASIRFPNSHPSRGPPLLFI